MDEYLALKSPTESIAFDFQVVRRLKVQPEAFCGSEVASQTEGSVGSDGPRTLDNLVDLSGRDVDVFGQAILSDAERLQVEDLAGKNRRWLPTGHWAGLLGEWNVDFE